MLIAAVGLSNLQFVDLNSARNLFILGFAFFMGLSLPEYFANADNVVTLSAAPWLADIVNTLGKTGMAVGAFTALILDNTIPGTDEERGLTAWSKSDGKKSPEEPKGVPPTQPAWDTMKELRKTALAVAETEQAPILRLPIDDDAGDVTEADADSPEKDDESS